MTELGKLLREAVEPETPPERLREIALGVDDVKVLGAVARNPSCPADVLEYLAGFPNPHLPESVALNPKAPAHLLEKLAESEWRRVRYEVGRNPSAPVHILEKLAQDGDDLVRMAVAENPSAPIPLLEKLAKDPSTTVRADLVWPAPRLPMRILEALGKDPEPYVRREVEARKKEEEVLFIVEESPEGGYVALARRAKHRVAQAVGASIYTQAETFEELKEKVLDAVRLHFEGEGPEAVRLSLVIPLRED